MTGRALPADFMARVVAWPGPDGPGWINCHWKPPAKRQDGTPNRGFRGKPYKDLGTFMDFIHYASSKTHLYPEIFFCLSTQRVTGRRLDSGHLTAHRDIPGAMFLKAIWLDIDVKPNSDKGYPTLPDALRAAGMFNQEADLPPPTAFVLSGGGLHIYWISDKPLTPEEWRPYAEGLKALALKHGLKCDAGCTADAARILRVPGTFNNKTDTPRPVVLKYLNDDDYDFAVDLKHIAVAPPTSSVVTAAVIPPAFDASEWGPVPDGFPDASEDKLADGISAGRVDLPLDPKEMEKKCLHFKDCVATNGKDHSQGLWNLTLLASTFLEDGEAKAHEYSRGYAAYTAEETTAKYEEKLAARGAGRAKTIGWPGCAAFEGEGVKCKTCPFYQMVRSPLNLADRVEPPSGMVGRAIPPPPLGMDLPPGYTINEQGYICEIITKETKNGTTQTVEPLFLSQLRNFVPQAQGSGTERKLNFETSLDKNNWGQVSIPEISIASESSLIRAFWQGGVKPNPKHQRRIAQFMTSFLAQLDAAKQRTQTAAYGWIREEGNNKLPTGFAYAGKAYMADGATNTTSVADNQLDGFYSPKGNEDCWWELFKFISAQKHPAKEAIIAVAFAGPLMFTTGLYNGAVVPWSPDAGSGKTTSIGAGAAVWGSPQMTKERVWSTVKGVARKFGYLRNLPIYYDEINSQKKIDEMREMLGPLTEGGGGSKLRQDRSFYDQESWQTVFVIGSNKSLVDNIMRNVSDTDAQLQRVFEFRVDANPSTALDVHEVTRMTNLLDHNYGHIGVKYARYLGHNVKAVDDLAVSNLERFDTEVDVRPPERFRSGMACSIYTGAQIANEQLGTDFHLPELWSFLKREFMGQRVMIATSQIITGTHDHTAAVLTEFFKTCTRNVLWVRRSPAKKAGPPAPVEILGGVNPTRPEPVHVRFAKEDAVVHISRKHLEKFLGEKQIAPREFIKAMEKHVGAKHDRLDLCAGAAMLGGREGVLEIDIRPGSPFEGDLYAVTPHEAPEGVVVTAPVTASNALTVLEQARKDLEKVMEENV